MTGDVLLVSVVTDTSPFKVIILVSDKRGDRATSTHNVLPLGQTSIQFSLQVFPPVTQVDIVLNPASKGATLAGCSATPANWSGFGNGLVVVPARQSFGCERRHLSAFRARPELVAAGRETTWRWSVWGAVDDQRILAAKAERTCYPEGLPAPPPPGLGWSIMALSLPIVFEVRAMEQGRVGDVIEIESEKVGRATRSGEILEVLGGGDLVHYLVRWDDDHKSVYYPSGAAATFRHRQPAR